MQLSATSELERAIRRDVAVAQDFEALVRLYRPKVFRFALASLRDLDAAESVTQDCFLRAYQARDRFRRVPKTESVDSGSDRGSNLLQFAWARFACRSPAADQQKRIDTLFQQNRLKLIDLSAALQKEEAIMEPLVEADRPDESQVLAQIDRVAQARAETGESQRAQAARIPRRADARPVEKTSSWRSSTAWSPASIKRAVNHLRFGTRFAYQKGDGGID
jgi:hypothetical protein